MKILRHNIRRIRKYLVVSVVFAHFFVTPQVFFASAASTEVDAELVILSPAPPEAAAPTAGVPGAALPGMILYPTTESVIFTPGEFYISPYVVVLEVSGARVFAGEIFRTYSREPVFLGKTNLREAVVYLQYDHLPSRVYTTFADIQGKWRWDSLVFLEPGWHTLHITAISPFNPYFTAYSAFQFYIASIPEGEITADAPPEDIFYPPAPPLPEKKFPVVEPVVPFKSPLIAPFKPMPKPTATPPLLSMPFVIDGKKDSFGVLLKVSPESKVIYPGDKLKIESKIVPLPPESLREEKVREARIRVRVYDEKGNVVFEKEEKREARGKLDLENIFSTSPSLEPGEYKVRLEVEENGTAFISQDTFVVEEKPALTPQAVFQSAVALKDELVKVSFVGTIFMLGFLFLLARERSLARRHTKIRDEELEKRGLINRKS